MGISIKKVLLSIMLVLSSCSDSPTTKEKNQKFVDDNGGRVRVLLVYGRYGQHVTVEGVVTDERQTATIENTKAIPGDICDIELRGGDTEPRFKLKRVVRIMPTLK